MALELPEQARIAGAAPRLLDFGIQLHAALGGETLRVDRAGSRWAIEVQLAAMKPDQARAVLAVLVRARSTPLRLAYPLLGVSQGAPGAPVVDGAGQSGTALNLTGLTPGWQAKPGYWLSLLDSSGRAYLHTVIAPASADATGNIALSIWPALRAPFADAATVLLGKPVIEGLVTSDISWSLPVDKVISPSFTIEEVA